MTPIKSIDPFAEQMKFCFAASKRTIDIAKRMRVSCPIAIYLALALAFIGIATPSFGLNAKERKAAKAAEQTFLESNGKKDGIVTTPSGLQYEILQKGDSERRPKGRDRIEIHYHGTLDDGAVFDSSLMRGEPIEVGLWDVIPGWTEGLKLMSPGDKFRFYVPSKLAYGSKGHGVIGPYATLVFEIEVIAIRDKKSRK